MILSIQSNVMHGYVGNRACLPLYQACHIESEHLDTVRLAAHPGHGTTARDILNGSVMKALFDDYLALPDKRPPQAVHIGYFGALDQIAPTAHLIKALKDRAADSVILLDPVFGDHGKAYIGADIIEAISADLIPLADIITPNQFELELLSGVAVTDSTSAEQALVTLNRKTGATIIGTGLLFEDRVFDALFDGITYHIISHPPKEAGVSGSGDAFAALFLSAILNGASHYDALQQASSLTHYMIQKSKSPLTLALASGLEKLAGLKF